MGKPHFEPERIERCALAAQVKIILSKYDPATYLDVFDIQTGQRFFHEDHSAVQISVERLQQHIEQSWFKGIVSYDYPDTDPATTTEPAPGRYWIKLTNNRRVFVSEDME